MTVITVSDTSSTPKIPLVEKPPLPLTGKYKDIVDLGSESPLYTIFSFLTFSDWFQLIAVNKQHNMLFKDHEYNLVVTLSVEEHGCIPWPVIQKLGKEHFQQLYNPEHPKHKKMTQSLSNGYYQKLLCSWLPQKRPIDQKASLQWLQSLPQEERALLRKLDLHPFQGYLSINDIRTFMTSMTQLQSLSFRYVFHEDFPLSTDIQEEFLNLNFPKLRDLDLSGCYFISGIFNAVFRGAPHLRRLSLSSSSSRFSSTNFVSLEKTELEELFLDGVTFDSFESFHTLLQQANNLQTLSLAQLQIFWNANDPDKYSFNDLEFKKMQKLTLSSNISELSNLIQSMPNLENLKLEHVDDLKASHFKGLLLSSLTLFHLHKCHLSGETLLAALSSFTKLQKVCLISCHFKKMTASTFFDLPKLHWEVIFMYNPNGLFQDLTIQSLLKGALQLKRIYFSRINFNNKEKLTEKSFFDLDPMPNLTKIRLDQCNFSGEKAVAALLQKSPHVKELFFCGIDDSLCFSESFLKDLNLSFLRTLSLSHCQISKAFIPKLLEKATKLQELILICKDVSRDHFKGLSPEHFKNIRVVGPWKNRAEFFREFFKNTGSKHQ
jgi:hypothetical protein